MQPVAPDSELSRSSSPCQGFYTYILRFSRVTTQLASIKPNLCLNVSFVTARPYKDPFYAPVQTESDMKTSPLCQAPVRAFVQLHKNSV